MFTIFSCAYLSPAYIFLSELLSLHIFCLDSYWIIFFFFLTGFFTVLVFWEFFVHFKS